MRKIQHKSAEELLLLLVCFNYHFRSYTTSAADEAEEEVVCRLLKFQNNLHKCTLFPYTMYQHITKPELLELGYSCLATTGMITT